MKRLYDKASKEKYAIGHFNFSTMAILHGITNAAVKLKSPVIVALSEGEELYFGADEAVAVEDALNYKHKSMKNQIVLHADHHKTFEACKRVADAGFQSIHIDASKNDFKTNLQITKKVVNYCKKKDIWVEGELGHVGGASTLHDVDISKVTGPEFMTDINEAKEFVEKTGVDALAINIGNAHGVWKGIPKLDFELLKKIKKLTKIPLVLHGGSGISEVDFKKAIRLGIDKININSEMRIAYGVALTKAMRARKNFTPYDYMLKPMSAVEKVVNEKIKIFGSENKL